MLIKRFLFAIVLLLATTSIKAATTYVPTYHSFISIKTANDEILRSEENGSISLSVVTEDFCISVVHEEMTKEKVRSIKRKKAAAGWMAASAVLSSISSMFSGSITSFEARTANARLSGLMTHMYAYNAAAEQKLKVQIQFQNKSPHEMMVADTERGLVWYVRSNDSFVMELDNPDVAQLRISDVKNTEKSPLYATVCGGSSVLKESIAFENDEIMIVTPIEEDNDIYHIPANGFEYRIINKDDYSQQPISFEEYKKIKKQK